MSFPDLRAPASLYGDQPDYKGRTDYKKKAPQEYGADLRPASFVETSPSTKPEGKGSAASLLQEPPSLPTLLKLPPLAREVLDPIAKAFEVPLPEKQDEETSRSLQRVCFQTVYQACREGKWDLIKTHAKLVEPLTNSSGQSLLLCAVDDFELEITEHLLKLQISLKETDLQGRNPLHVAANSGFLAALPLLLQNGFEINSKNAKNRKTALHEAIEGDQPEIVQYLVAQGASLDIAASCQEVVLTPPALAVYLGLQQAFDTLVDTAKRSGKTIDFNQTTQKGNFLHLAISADQFPMLRHLLDKYHEQTKSLLEKPDPEGRVPLSLAAFLGVEGALELLHQKGANLEAQDSEGRRAVHYAAMGKQGEALQWLAHLGAKFQVEDQENQRPEDYLSKQDPLHSLIRNLKAKKTTEIPSPTRQPPENLIFQGAGISIISHLGVIQALEQRKALGSLKRLAGISSGALMATLLATNHTAPEIEKLLTATSPTHFLDDPVSDLVQRVKEKSFTENLKLLGTYLVSKVSGSVEGVAMNVFKDLLKLNGLFIGENLRKWIEAQIAQKTKIPFCTFKEFRTLIHQGKPFKHIHLVGINVEPPYDMTHFSSEDPQWDNFIISDTVRVAMSLPGIFVTQPLYEKRGGERHPRKDLGHFVDPSMIYCFPFDIFDQKKYKTNRVLEEVAHQTSYNPRTWGVSIQSSQTEEIDPPTGDVSAPGLAFQLLRIQSQAGAILSRFKNQKEDRVMVVAVPKLGTFEFSPSPEKQKELIAAGAKGVDTFLGDWDIGRVGLAALFSDPVLLRRKRAQGVLNLRDSHPDFIGREAILQALTKGIIESPKNYKVKSQVTVLMGEGGVGKTELAIAFANIHLEDFSLVWWIDVEKELSYDLGYRSLASALKISVKDEDPTSLVVGKVNRHLETANFEKPFLLIFDNLEAFQVTPPARGGIILMTTKTKGVWDDLIEVPPFGKKEALDLLEKVTGEKRSSQMEGLAEDLGYLPLLINAAAHYIKATPTWNIQRYREVLAKRIGEKEGPLWQAKDARDRYTKTLAASWEITLERLHTESPLAAEWLALCAYFNSSSIPESWIDIWLEQKGMKQDQGALEKGKILREAVTHFRVLSYNEESGMLSLHRFWQTIIQIQRQASKPTDLQEVLAVLGDFGLKIHEGVGITFEEKVAWKLHFVRFVESSQGVEIKPSEKIAGSLINIGIGLSALGDEPEALKYKMKALEMFIKLLGSEHLKVALSLNNVGNSLSALGHEREGLKCKKEALEMYKKLLKGEHLDVARSLDNVGTSLYALGEHSEALKYRREALAMRKKLLGSVEHRDMATSLNNVGISLAALGDNREALKYFGESMEMFRKLFGKEHPQVAMNLNNIGGSLYALQDYKGALEYQKEALEMRRKLLGAEHPDVAISLANMGNNLAALGDEGEALNYRKEALKMSRQLLGSEHPSVAMCLQNVGCSLFVLGDHREALKYFREAVEIKRKLLGPEHPSTAISLANVGDSLFALGEYSEALKYKREALEIACKVFKQPHSDLVRNLQGVISVLHQIQDRELVEKTKAELYPLCAKVLGESHAEVRALLKVEAKAKEGKQSSEKIKDQSLLKEPPPTQGKGEKEKDCRVM